MTERIRAITKWGIIFVVLLLSISVTLYFFRGSYTPTPDLQQFFNASDEFDLLESVGLNDDLSVFVHNLESGGPPPDGIPPIDDPQYIAVEEADEFLEPESPVFVVEMNGEVKIFPQQIMVWHEVVNDSIGGEDISVTYCPLSGSVVGYKNQFDEVLTNFGTSGKLLNSNLVLYDRETNSLFPQILGKGISGPGRGANLETFPVIWTTWSNAQSVYPDALVLSKKTGFIKSYGFDPYGSYLKEGNYYDSEHVFFSVMNEDARLAPKDVVVAVKGAKSNIAFVKSSIERQGSVQANLDGQRVVAVWDDALDTARVYKAPYFNDAG